MSTEKGHAADQWRRLASAGVVMQGLGLGVDGWLHARDPGLAARESPFSLGNVGHVVFAVGLALVAFALARPALRAGFAGRLVTPIVVGVMTVAFVGAAATSSMAVPGHGDGNAIGVAAARARAARILPGFDHDHVPVPDRFLDPSTRSHLGAQLVEARAVALRYPTVADAEAAGYRRATPYVPLVGAHYVRFDLLGGDFDVEHPAIVLFDGTEPAAHVVGVSYHVAAAAPPDGFAGPNDHWHRHQALCLDDNDVVVGGDRLSRAQCRRLGGHQVDATQGWMLHGWVVPGWDSPQGVFSTENTDLR